MKLYTERFRCLSMIEQEKYNQASISQLIKIEKDLRKLNETMLCLVLQEIMLNRLNLKTLDVQFNIKEIKESELEAEFEKTLNMVKKYSDKVKVMSNLLSLPSPSGSE